LLRQLLRRFGVPLLFTAITAASSSATMTTGTVEEQLAGKRQPTQFGRALEQLGVTFIAANSPQAKGRVSACGAYWQDRLTSELRLARSHGPGLRQCRAAVSSSPTTTAVSLGSRAKRNRVACCSANPRSYLLLGARAHG